MKPKTWIIFGIIAVLLIIGIFTIIIQIPNAELKNKSEIQPDIEIKNFAFTPSEIEIKVGQTLTWINKDSAPHIIFSDSADGLNSLELTQGQTYSYTFKTVGTFDYYCSIHPTMRGKVIVAI